MTTGQHERERDGPDWQRHGTRRTVNDRMKRAGGLALGTGLLLGGLRRRSLRGAVMALVGAAVLARTLGGDAGREGTHGFRPARGPTADRTAQAAVSRSVTVGASADELYEAWRDPVVFSRVMGRFADIAPVDEDRYRWTFHGPGGVDLSWETRVVEAEPGEVVRWEAPADASVPNSGSVRFRPAPDDRGTVVTLSLDFDPPGGSVGTAALQRLEIVPETLAGHALRRFKSLVETGEAPTLAGNPSGRGTGDLL